MKKGFLKLMLTFVVNGTALAVVYSLVGIIWWLTGHIGLTLFEDGSWYIFHRLFWSGCVPHMACNIGR